MSEESTALVMLYDAGHTGRLSVREFGTSQHALGNAIKRTADSESGALAAVARKPGQYTAFARSIDVSMVGFQTAPGGARVDFLVSRDAQTTAATDVSTPPLDAVVDRFMGDLEREARGEQCNEAVRRYLVATAWSKASALHKGKLVAMSPPPIDTTTRPNLARVFRGDVVGVGVELGSEYVRLREGSESHQFVANVALVTAAYELKGQSVRASVFLRSGRWHLSAIGPADRLFGGDEATRTTAMLARWSKVLGELAK